MENYMALLVATTVCRLQKNKYLLWVLLLVHISACEKKTQVEKETLPFYNSAQFDAEWIKANDKAYTSIHKIDTFALKNQLGNIINNDSLAGKIYVANFFFSVCPSICPKMMSNLKVLQNTYADNRQVQLVSFSVMPWVDTVEKLKAYGEKRQINPKKWYLLTGSKERIYTLARESFFAEKTLGLQKKGKGFLNTESMLLIDKKGRIRGIYNATQEVDIERVRDDIKVLLEEI